MSLNRRLFSLSLMGSLLSACVGGGSAPVVRSSGVASFPPQANPAFDAWLAAFRDSKAGGFSAGTQAQLMQAQFLPGVIEREFSRPGPKPAKRRAPGKPSALGFGSFGSRSLH